ncbi:MAG: cupin domain-containing protein [Zetaproteobacteria bacterium CG_4_9_14_3_um_filter_49_83]|nr:MAG: hypothetical protein AUJ56_08920 [Zetaproteobacteria bacterium CG1_02_49_23]PIQ32297.1 MAG: hypothetical protein COW62_07905 [Zetaproteobacteria bacterium CG17_big_fil_post_rev_8_21_14_2_50_50_13]PIV30064.1 MAG: cupin domain-containing protein [Zetaproteobacteria bacterium CG02_land_8_20_14_3_00_50_9]PIY56983.1 MAG: cupin domain-containing protein [Zetaproteobacteria bacterium CG_4_10_14_0_8_um_filter_49_80]PJA34650.1 MAG: cupin domain-containing protein [Zetaproteobacteria bacterium CG
MKLVQLDHVKVQGLSHDADILKRVLLNESELPASVRLSHAVFKPGQQASAHSHADLHEIFYVLAGTGQMLIDGVAFALAQGSCIRIDPGEVHELSNSGESDMSVLYFGLMAEN